MPLYMNSFGNIRDRFRGLPETLPSAPTFSQLNVQNYRLTNTSNWRAKVAQAKAGRRRTRVACLGDSTTLAFGGGNTGSIDGAKTNSYPGRTAAYLASAGVPTTYDNFVGGFYNAGVVTSSNMVSYDPKFTAGSGWGPSATNSVGGWGWLNSTTTNALTYAPVGTVDTFEIYYRTTAALGSFSYAVDSGTATTITQSVADDFKKVTVIVAPGTHVLNLFRVSGSVEVQSIIAYNSTVAAVDILNCGWYSTKLSDWNVSTHPWDWLPSAKALNADLYILKLGINEWDNTTDIPTMTANLQAVLMGLRSVGDVIVAFDNQSSSAATVQSPYLTAIRAVTEQFDVPLVDLYHYDGSYTANNAAGKMYDQYHPKKVIYDAEGALFANVIGSQPAAIATSTFNPVSLVASEQAVYLDLSDPTSIFSDIAGTTQAVIGGPIARISDKSGKGNHLVQAMANLQPYLRRSNAGYLYADFDGVSQYLRAMFAMSGTWTRVSILRPVSYGGTYRRALAGVTAAAGYLFGSNTPDVLQLWDGTNSAANPAALTGYDLITVERHSGATSRLRINNGAYVSGSPGTTQPGGLTIGADETGASPQQMRLMALFQVNRDMTDADITALVNCFATRGEIVPI